MKIVKFKDGTYAIRRLSVLGWMYLDLQQGYWWRRHDKWFTDCKGTLEQVKLRLQHETDKGTAVSSKELL